MSFDLETQIGSLSLQLGQKQNEHIVNLGKEEYSFMTGGIWECFLWEEMLVLNLEGFIDGLWVERMRQIVKSKGRDKNKAVKVCLDEVTEEKGRN